MKKDIHIRILTTQQVGKKKDTLNNFYRGTLDSDEGVLVLHYDESRSPHIHTRLIVSPTNIDLLRSGDVAMHTVFCKGKAYPTKYHTAMGALNKDIATSSLSVVTNAEGHVEIDICYDLLSFGKRVATNRLHIQTFEPQEKL